MKKFIVIFVVFILILAGGLYGYNYYNLQTKLNSVLEQDSRNTGINVSVHYLNYIEFNILEYDIIEIGGSNSMADVFRVLLQFAEKVKTDNFAEIILSHNGKNKFKLKGNYFKKLGEEYSYQNPIYTMRTFPENVLTLKDEKAFPTWEGGLLGVSKKQIEDFNEFHKKWYLNEY